MRKNIIFIMVGVAMVTMLCNTTNGMMEENISISYTTTTGENVNKSFSSVSLKNMSKGEYGSIRGLVQKVLGFVESYMPEEYLLTEIEKIEKTFLGSEDTSMLADGYKFLMSHLNDPEFIKKLDGNLLMIYTNAKNVYLCRTLAEMYKEKANLSSLAFDYVKAAFWFRMMYVSGAHSSSLEEYEVLTLRSGLKK